MRSVNHLRKIGIAVIAALLAIAALILAYMEFPWNRHEPISILATGLLVIAVAEYTPIETGTTRFRFRMAAQLPFAMLFGLFPVLVMQLLMMTIRQVGIYALTRSFTFSLSRFVSSFAVPFAAMVWYDEWQLHLSATGFHRTLLQISTILLFWILALSAHSLPGVQSAKHPWQPVRGWPLLLLGLDGFLAVSAIAESMFGHALVDVIMGLQLVTVVLATGFAAHACMQRARLIQIPALLEGLTQDTAAPALANHLFEATAALLSVDVLELWHRQNGPQLNLSYRRDFQAASQLELVDELSNSVPSVQPGEGLVGFCASSRDVVWVGSSRQPLLFAWDIDRSQFPSAMAVPILDDDEVQAVLVMYHRRSVLAYRKHDREVIHTLASHFSQLYHSLRRLEVTKLQSETDELTGLNNYRYFDMALHECVHQSDEVGLPVSLLILDIDHFKQINDTYGHLAGNEVLQQLADVFRDMLREDDIIARYGGEEFTILLPGLGQNNAEVIAERIRHRVEEMVFEIHSDLDGPPNEDGPAGIARHLIQLTVSIGVATYPTNAESSLTLIRHADRAMYIGSKQSGRNRVTVYVGAE